jgi:hypothetical protein
MTAPVSYSDRMDVRVEPRLREALQALAAMHGIKPAELIRNLLWTGISLSGTDEHPAIRADGKRRYAHLLGGVLTDIVYRDPTPDPES